MTKVRALTVCAILASICAAGDAAAEASASVTLSNISYMLINLNPNDGIAPSVSFDNSNIWTTSAAVVDINDAVNNVHSEQGQQAYGASTAVQASLSSGALSASAQLGGNGTMSGMQLSASSVAVGNGTVSNNTTASTSSGYYAFTLSPMTAIIFTANSAIAAATTVGYNGTQVEYASGETVISANSFDGIGHQRQYIASDSLGASFGLNADWTYTGESITHTGMVDLAISNLTNQSDGGMVMFSVSTDVTSFAAPVPEPATYAMLAAGLALIGVVKRRRA